MTLYAQLSQDQKRALNHLAAKLALNMSGMNLFLSLATDSKRRLRRRLEPLLRPPLLPPFLG